MNTKKLMEELGMKVLDVLCIQKIRIKQIGETHTVMMENMRSLCLIFVIVVQQKYVVMINPLQYLKTINLLNDLLQ